MKYREIADGIFVDRPNRFIAHVEVNGAVETVHVKNTGRCRELLLPGTAVRLEVSDNPKRKTKYDLVAVHKQGLGWVNMDSQAPNKVVGEWLAKQGYDYIKPEFTYGKSRIDSIKYKVDVNTMEHLSIDNGKLSKETLPMQLNQIARVVLTTAKELFFDPYRQNKATGSFILIDPITNNTSAVGMIIDRVEDKDMHLAEDLPILNLPKLGIAPEHYEAIEKAVKELERQGVAVRIERSTSL